MKLNLNKQAILNKVNDAFELTMDEVHQGNREAIAAEVYPWPRTTVRQNGDVVGSPRDVIDTKALFHG